MAFVKAKGIKGKIYIPDSKKSPKKHSCKDCYTCQVCSDSRCTICRSSKKKGGKPVDAQ